MAIQDFTAGQILTAAQMDSLQANDYNWTVSTKTANYVLVAADKGTRVVMNAAGATTITVNTSLFSAGDTLFIQNIGAGTCTITAGTATVTTAGSLALGTWAGGTLYFTSASAAIFFSGGAPTWGTATGGIGAPTAVTISGVNYEYLTFNSTGTLTVTRSGFFDYLAIGGGGGAMKVLANIAGGGGGAGQVRIGSVYLSANQTITIGAGGAILDQQSAAANDFTQAGNTSIAATSPFTQIATGNLATILSTAGSGAYIGGGVGASNGEGVMNFTADTSFGFKGGTSSATTNAGGGGGQSGAGGNGSSTTGGTGGAGFDISAFIGGSASFKAQGGGGGGSVTGGTAATGGVAGSATTTPSSGGANTGQGGGGGYGLITTGAGGSGICYIRWVV
jgi:hypothetical protein